MYEKAEQPKPRQGTEPPQDRPDSHLAHLQKYAAQVHQQLESATRELDVILEHLVGQAAGPEANADRQEKRCGGALGEIEDTLVACLERGGAIHRRINALRAL